MPTATEVIAKLAELPPDKFMFQLYGWRGLVRIVVNGQACDCPATALARHMTGNTYSQQRDLNEALFAIGLTGPDAKEFVCAADDCEAIKHKHDPNLRPLLLTTLRNARLLKED